ncbi:MAG: hypothetical protein M3434_06685, partial [Gemmatimonadota bacterium]|nr:hypothetical protein [Gemmatimonadota bacterium]
HIPSKELALLVSSRVPLGWTVAAAPSSRGNGSFKPGHHLHGTVLVSDQVICSGPDISNGQGHRHRVLSASGQGRTASEDESIQHLRAVDTNTVLDDANGVWVADVDTGPSGSSRLLL